MKEDRGFQSAPQEALRRIGASAARGLTPERVSELLRIKTLSFLCPAQRGGDPIFHAFLRFETLRLGDIAEAEVAGQKSEASGSFLTNNQTGRQLKGIGRAERMRP